MNFIENVEVHEYEEFVKNHPTKSHFMQSYYWGEVSKEKNLIPHYVGLKKDGKLVATALLLEKKLIGNMNYLYCPRGFVCDYTDLEVIKEFTKHLKRYGKKKNAIYVKINPDIKLQDLDSDGNIINNNKNNFELINYLIKLGYEHQGFNKNFEGSEPRYTFRLKLENLDEVRKNLHPTTRNIINRGNLYDINLYKGTNQDMEDFYQTMLETSARENLVIHPIQYYQQFYDILNKHNMSDVYLAKVNIDNLKKNYEERINNLKNELDSLDPNTYKNKNKYDVAVTELKQQIEKNEKELKEVQDIKEKEIVLSSIITVKYNDKVWTVHGGNHNLLKFLNANYWVYYYIIKDAIKNNYKIVDFFGTTGNPDKNNPIYGIHLFKMRFGGEYTEFIGEFDLVTNKFMYFMYTKVFTRYRKLKRKLKKRS